MINLFVCLFYLFIYFSIYSLIFLSCTGECDQQREKRHLEPGVSFGAADPSFYFALFCFKKIMEQWALMLSNCVVLCCTVFLSGILVVLPLRREKQNMIMFFNMAMV